MTQTNTVDSTLQATRRGFLKGTSLATTGLILGVSVPFTVQEAAAAGTMHTPNA